MLCRLTSPRERSVLALLSVPLLALCVLPSLGSAQIEVLDQVVAIVDDDIILASELQERVQGVRSTMESRGVEVPSDDVLIRETLDRLILDSIQLQLANRYGVRIPDQQLDEAMTRLARQNGLTLEQFRIALEQSGQSYAAAREGLRDDLAIQRVQQGNVMRNINISEQEIDTVFSSLPDSISHWVHNLSATAADDDERFPRGWLTPDVCSRLQALGDVIGKKIEAALQAAGVGAAAEPSPEPAPAPVALAATAPRGPHFSFPGTPPPGAPPGGFPVVPPPQYRARYRPISVRARPGPEDELVLWSDFLLRVKVKIKFY